MKHDKETESEGPKPFGDFVRIAVEGEMHNEATTALHDLLCRLQDASLDGTAKGSFTLKVNLSADSGGVVDITYDVSTKAPKPRRAKGAMWLTKGANLTTQNPRQQLLGLREIKTEQTMKEAK